MGEGHVGPALVSWTLLGAPLVAQAPGFPGAHLGFIPLLLGSAPGGLLPQACQFRSLPAAWEAWAQPQGSPLKERDG